MSDKLPVWHIYVREVWTQRVDIEADTLKEAVALVIDGDVDWDTGKSEYCDTQGVETWTAEDENFEIAYDDLVDL